MQAEQEVTLAGAQKTRLMVRIWRLETRLMRFQWGTLTGVGPGAIHLTLWHKSSLHFVYAVRLWEIKF